MSDLMMTRFDSVRPAAGRIAARHPVRWLHLALRTWLTRQALPDLSPHARADIGLTATSALAEAARLPWDTNPGPRGRGPGIVAAIQRSLERARTRRLIGQLSAHELRDIGLGPSDAHFEATKFFWEI